MIVVFCLHDLRTVMCMVNYVFFPLESQRDVVLYPQRLSHGLAQAKHHRVMCVMTNRLHSLQAELASANCAKSAFVLVRLGS